MTSRDLLAKKLPKVRIYNVYRDGTFNGNIAISIDEESSGSHVLLAKLLPKVSLVRILEYLTEHGAGTVLTISHGLDMNERTVRWALRRLFHFGFVEVKAEVKTGGRPAKVWALPHSDPAQVHKAITEHMKIASPIYRRAHQIAQQILDQYIKPKGLKEITLKELRQAIIHLGLGPINPDILDQVAWILQKHGVRVWR